MKIRRFSVAACAACTILALGACSSESNKASASQGAMAVKADNTICPVGNNPVSTAVAPTTYKGKNVGFCCAGCKGKFDKMSEADKDAKVASMR